MRSNRSAAIARGAWRRLAGPVAAAILMAPSAPSRADARSILDDVRVVHRSKVLTGPPLRYVCVFYASIRRDRGLDLDEANRVEGRVAVDNLYAKESDEALSLGMAKVSLPAFRRVAEQGVDGDGNPMVGFSALDLSPAWDVEAFEKALVSPPPTPDCPGGAPLGGPTAVPLMYVHGWRSGFGDALVDAAQLAVDLPRTGPVVAFDWPSDRYGYFGYHGAEAEEVRAHHKMHVVVEMVANATGRQVDVVAHSMGARVVFDALLHWRADGGDPADARTMISNAVFAAPDLGRPEFDAGIAAARPLVAGGLTVYCGRDGALTFSMSYHVNGRLGLCFGDPPRLPLAASVGIRGSIAGVVPHSYFLGAAEVIRDMGVALAGGGAARDGSVRTLEIR